MLPTSEPGSLYVEKMNILQSILFIYLEKKCRSCYLLQEVLNNARRPQQSNFRNLTIPAFLEFLLLVHALFVVTPSSKQKTIRVNCIKWHVRYRAMCTADNRIRDKSFSRCWNGKHINCNNAVHVVQWWPGISPYELLDSLFFCLTKLKNFRGVVVVALKAFRGVDKEV